MDFSGNELSADAAKIVIKKWKELFVTTKQNLKLKMSSNCFGSQFQDVEDATENTFIDVGEEEDDEGAVSIDSEQYESVNGNEENLYNGEMSKGLDGEKEQTTVDDLLSNIRCMNLDESKLKNSEDDVVSFVDQQLKLNSVEDAELVAQTIEKHLHVRVLELRGNSLGIDSGKRIAQAIKLHPELQKSLCSSMISAGCHITELDLSDNALGPIGAEAILRFVYFQLFYFLFFTCDPGLLGVREFLVSPAAFSLEILKLNNNGLGEGGKVIAECLSECHRLSVKSGRPLKLRTFMAGRNRLEVQGAIAFAAAFTVHYCFHFS
ncbi:leucine Rich repeat-containing domain protein [Dictyocaulus viviparus]|uniref:Leucine Rich repeat-containing domain protein n=1 Tax=Dictyocaulus viviparus TaxID=29172 RepID=A0A0D8Y0S5_DICVI|nr:leucine Rich repeat-containing domain protein [Dictyocaulus viviparus]